MLFSISVTSFCISELLLLFFLQFIEFELYWRLSFWHFCSDVFLIFEVKLEKWFCSHRSRKWSEKGNGFLRIFFTPQFQSRVRKRCLKKFAFLILFFVHMRQYDFDFNIFNFWSDFLCDFVSTLVLFVCLTNEHSLIYVRTSVVFLLRRMKICFALPHFAAFSTFGVKSSRLVSFFAHSALCDFKEQLLSKAI